MRKATPQSRKGLFVIGLTIPLLILAAFAAMDVGGAGSLTKWLFAIIAGLLHLSVTVTILLRNSADVVASFRKSDIPLSFAPLGIFGCGLGIAIILAILYMVILTPSVRMQVYARHLGDTAHAVLDADRVALVGEDASIFADSEQQSPSGLHAANGNGVFVVDTVPPSVNLPQRIEVTAPYDDRPWGDEIRARTTDPLKSFSIGGQTVFRCDLSRVEKISGHLEMPVCVPDVVKLGQFVNRTITARSGILEIALVPAHLHGAYRTAEAESNLVGHMHILLCLGSGLLISMWIWVAGPVMCSNKTRLASPSEK